MRGPTRSCGMGRLVDPPGCIPTSEAFPASMAGRRDQSSRRIPHPAEERSRVVRRSDPRAGGPRRGSGAAAAVRNERCRPARRAGRCSDAELAAQRQPTPCGIGSDPLGIGAAGEASARLANGATAVPSLHVAGRRKPPRAGVRGRHVVRRAKPVPTSRAVKARHKEGALATDAVSAGDEHARAQRRGAHVGIGPRQRAPRRARGPDTRPSGAAWGGNAAFAGPSRAVPPQSAPGVGAAQPPRPTTRPIARRTTSPTHGRSCNPRAKLDPTVGERTATSKQVRCNGLRRDERECDQRWWTQPG